MKRHTPGHAGLWALITAAAMLLSLAGCTQPDKGTTEAQTAAAPSTEAATAATTAPEPETEEPATESGYDGNDITVKNGDVYILFTSDMHCAMDQGFGLAGLKQIRDSLEAQGYTTILVDDGDAIQGELLGTVSRGETIIELMNDMDYDAAVPGNHEFDYGVDRFLELTEKADFPYISCNFNKGGEPLFDPYVIIEAEGRKIAFVGVTTPLTLTSSTPAYFMDDNGNYVYGFMQDETGETLYAAIQKSVDDARAEGADFVYVMGHVGMGTADSLWTYSAIIEHTRGIDVFLDGHTHDTEQVVMKNMDGEDVVRSACGTKLGSIGYSHITADGEIADTGIWTWQNKISAPELFAIDNEITEKTAAAYAVLEEEMNRVIATSTVDLTINDPVEKDASGTPIRMIRRAETNLGDLCADSFRVQGNADIGMVNGGGIRANIAKGDITFGDINKVYAFGNYLCVVEATGQQILDALEWSVRKIPSEFGAFLQVSGMSYEVDVNVESGCIADENNMMAGIEGGRRVKNVLVGGEPIDPQAKYTVASTDYVLLENGDGTTAFDGAVLLQDCVKIDNQMLADFFVDDLGGVIGEEYADPYGQGRITIID